MLVVGVLLLAPPVLIGAIEGKSAETDLGGFHTPIDFSPLPDDSAAVLEDLDGVVRVARGGSRTTLPGLSLPRALATDETGLLLVLDGFSHVVAYRRGKETWRTRLAGEPKPPARAAGMAAKNGILWILDRSPPKAFLYAYDGKSLGTVDLRPWARSPFSVALGPTGEAYITDPLGPAILSLSPAGSYLATFKLVGTGVTRPSGVAVDDSGRIWLSDGVTGTLACLSSKGEPQRVKHEGRPPRFQDPIRLGWARGSLWVLEGRPGRIRRVQWEEP